MLRFPERERDLGLEAEARFTGLVEGIQLLVVLKMKIIVKAERNLQLLGAIHAVRDPTRPSLLLQFWQIIFLSHTTSSLLFLGKHLDTQSRGSATVELTARGTGGCGQRPALPSEKQQLESIKSWPGLALS
jgi:hypothetical protein